MSRPLLLLVTLLLAITLGILTLSYLNKREIKTNDGGANDSKTTLNPLSIEALRQREYPGSDITIEETLTAGSNYQRYIASYKSDGLKIYALLTVPNGQKPQNGWPVVIFNHGYISPKEYKTTERYIAYTDAFSRNGFIVFKPDFRGNGNSEGEATGAYGSSGYTTDVLNAVSSIKKHKDADAGRIGMWGHSMGGFITLRAMVISADIKAGVIWAGVVGSYEDLLARWRRPNASPYPSPSGFGGSWRRNLIEQYGDFKTNPAFWQSISANSYVKDISGPLQLQHGSADPSVPVEFSQKLNDELKAADKEVGLYIYPGDDHNISNNLNIALQRSVDFFDKYLKQ